MSAIFVVRKAGITRYYDGRYMGEAALAIFTRGPNYAVHIASDLPSISKPEASSSGFFIDQDSKHASVFDHGVCFDREDARVNGWVLGTTIRASALRELLIDPEEECIFEVLKLGVTPEAFITALTHLPLDTGWKDWSVTWTNSSDFIRDTVVSQ